MHTASCNKKLTRGRTENVLQTSMQLLMICCENQTGCITSFSCKLSSLPCFVFTFALSFWANRLSSEKILYIRSRVWLLILTTPVRNPCHVSGRSQNVDHSKRHSLKNKCWQKCVTEMCRMSGQYHNCMHPWFKLVFVFVFNLKFLWLSSGTFLVWWMFFH